MDLVLNLTLTNKKLSVHCHIMFWLWVWGGGGVYFSHFLFHYISFIILSLVFRDAHCHTIRPNPFTFLNMLGNINPNLSHKPNHWASKVHYLQVWIRDTGWVRCRHKGIWDVAHVPLFDVAFFMEGIFSFILSFRVCFVCPMYSFLHTLYFIQY